MTFQAKWDTAQIERFGQTRLRWFTQGSKQHVAQASTDIDRFGSYVSVGRLARIPEVNGRARQKPKLPIGQPQPEHTDTRTR